MGRCQNKGSFMQHLVNPELVLAYTFSSEAPEKAMFSALPAYVVLQTKRMWDFTEKSSLLTFFAKLLHLYLNINLLILCTQTLVWAVMLLCRASAGVCGGKGERSYGYHLMDSPVKEPQSGWDNQAESACRRSTDNWA